MRSNIGKIATRVGLNLKKSGTDVVLKWKEWTGTPTVDPTTESEIGESTDQTETVQGFVHYIQATTSLRQFGEVEVGDCIVDLHQDVDIDGKQSLVFIIDGEEWKQKQIGDKLAKYWAVMAQGQKLFRTVLLRKTT